MRRLIDLLQHCFSMYFRVLWIKED
jgi:hypothetical protein